MEVELRAEPLDGPIARQLIAELDANLSSLYPPEETFFALPTADVFLVARIGDRPVGCGALRKLDATTAEVKRMYVRPEAEGNGIGGRIVEALADWAARDGVTRLVLETGARQHAAIALYERCGFTPIPAFGTYVSSPSSRCYERLLSLPSSHDADRRPSDGGQST